MKPRIAKYVPLLIAAILLFASAVLFVNSFLSRKFKDILATGLSNPSVGKRVEIGSLRFNILQGIILRDIVLKSRGKVILQAHKAKARFNLLSLFTGRLFISSVSIDSPSLWLERDKNGTWNLDDFLQASTGIHGRRAPPLRIIVSNAAVSRAEIALTDYSVTPPARKIFCDAQGQASLSMSGRITFTVTARAKDSALTIAALGAYLPPEASLTLTVKARNLDSSEILPYLNNTGISRLGGLVDAETETVIKNSSTRISIRALSKKIFVTTAEAGFSGGAVLKSAVDLEAGKPASWSGDIQINAGRFTRPQPLTRFTLAGPLHFENDAISWTGLNIFYAGKKYVSSGSFKDFRNPAVELGVFSPELQLEASAESAQGVMTVKRIRAKYKESVLSCQGTINLSMPNLPARLTASGDIELGYLVDSGIMTTTQARAVRPSGQVIVAMDFDGGLGAPGLATASGTLKSGAFSLYGLRGGNLSIKYRQAAGKGEAFANCVAYEGIVNTQTQIEFSQPRLPYSIGGSIEGLKIELLKMDTPAREKNLSGTLNLTESISGKIDGLCSLEGNGNISLKNGNLWQLDILAGLGQLLFPELGTLTFNQGYTDFTIKNGIVHATNLALVSDAIKLAGKADIGFDSSLNARISVQVSNQLIPRLGKLRALAGIILKQATGHFVGAHITGSLQKPKYTLTQPIISDILDGLKRILTGKERKPQPGGAK